MAKTTTKVKSLNLDSSKSKTEKYTVSSLKAVVPQIRTLDGQMEKLVEQRDLMKKMILNTVKPLKEKEERAGHLYKTFIIESDDGVPATVLFKNAFSKIPADNEPEMRKNLGEHFDELYEVTTQIALRRNVKWEDLRKVLGSKFDDFFGETKIISHKSDFMERRAELRGAAPKKVNDALDVYTKDCQATPDLRMKG